MTRKALYKREKPKWWDLVCQDCKKPFKSYSVKGKARFCKECLHEKRKEAGKKHHEPKRAICKLCGEEYIAMGYTQKYCKKCQKKKDYERTVRWRSQQKMKRFWEGTSLTKFSQEYALKELEKTIRDMPDFEKRIKITNSGS